MSVSPNCFDTSAGMGAATPPYRSTPTLRLDRGLCHSLHQPTPGTSASPADLLRHLGWTGGFAIALSTYPGTSASPADQLRHLGWTGGFVSPHRLCHVATSSSRALRSGTSGPAWGLGPRPAASSARIINTEHINQLSRFHAQLFQLLIYVRFDQALYLC
jgi:hypothetical protein